MIKNILSYFIIVLALTSCQPREPEHKVRVDADAQEAAYLLVERTKYCYYHGYNITDPTIDKYIAAFVMRALPEVEITVGAGPAFDLPCWTLVASSGQMYILYFDMTNFPNFLKVS